MGALTRVHGGGTTTQMGVEEEAPFTPCAPQEAPFTLRASKGAPAKQTIGHLAAQLVSSGQTIILDVGTTALAVARALPISFQGVVATCSLLVAAELAKRPMIEVLVSGGRVRAGDLSLSNAQTLDFFTDLRADIAFLGSGGVSAASGITDYHLDEVATRRVIISNASRSFILADSGKLDFVAPHRVCSLAEVSGLITEGSVPASVITALERTGGTIISAAAKTGTS